MFKKPVKRDIEAASSGKDSEASKKIRKDSDSKSRSSKSSKKGDKKLLSFNDDEEEEDFWRKRVSEVLYNKCVLVFQDFCPSIWYTIKNFILRNIFSLFNNKPTAVVCEKWVDCHVLLIGINSWFILELWHKNECSIILNALHSTG